MLDALNIDDAVLGVGHIEDFIFFLIEWVLFDIPSESALLHDIYSLSSKIKGNILAGGARVKLLEFNNFSYLICFRMRNATVELSFKRVNQLEGFHKRFGEEILPFFVLLRINTTKFIIAKECVICIVEFLWCFSLRYFQLARVVQYGLNILFLLECWNHGCSCSVFNNLFTCPSMWSVAFRFV